MLPLGELRERSQYLVCSEARGQVLGLGRLRHLVLGSEDRNEGSEGSWWSHLCQEGDRVVGCVR